MVRQKPMDQVALFSNSSPSSSQKAPPANSLVLEQRLETSR